MCTRFLSAAVAVIVGGLIYYMLPLLKAKQAGLSVLLVGRLRWSSTDGKQNIPGLSLKQVERLFKQLQKMAIPTFLPQDILRQQSATVPAVLLVFTGGYKTIYTHIFPLLKKYRLKAAVTLPVRHIGQYDAWEPKGPWQDLLTPSQLQEMKSSGRVEFISQLLDGGPLSENEQEAIWQLEESKARLKNLYAITAQAVYLTNKKPLSLAQQTQAKIIYPLQIGEQIGSNLLPVSNRPLRVRHLKRQTWIPRLLWQLQRP